MEMRDSGIDIIGEIPWGTHIGQVYESKEEFFDTAIPFIMTGLKNNELCIWIYAANTSADEIKYRLSKHCASIEDFLRSGQLAIVPYNQWYLANGTFSADDVKRKWANSLAYLKEHGYDGLRAVGDTSWISDSLFGKFMDYESTLHKKVHSVHCLVVCLYFSPMLDTFKVAEAVSHHNYVIMKHNGSFKLINNSALSDNDVQVVNELSDMPKYYEKIKFEFFNNISHELRTPLNVILSAVKLLKLQSESLCSDSYEIKYINMRNKNCNRLIRLVNNLIDIIKIDNDYFNIKLQNYNIIGILERIVPSVAEYAESRCQKIIFNTDVKEKVIAVDPVQIERIILNLLSNAIKFTPRGGCIKIDVNNMDDKLRLTVKDNGIGISSDKLQHLFDRFHQADSGLTREYEGSGIGLSLVKAIVEKHGGSITVRSGMGEGTMFTVELPCTVLDISSEYDNSTCIDNDFFNRIKIEFSDIYS